jgi:hypothetical protein
MLTNTPKTNIYPETIKVKLLLNIDRGLSSDDMVQRKQAA